MPDFDVVVIGSGFGGAITACRLAEAGYKVLILERGRRWEVKDYPRRLGDDAWVWDQNNPAKYNGWIDLRLFPKMGVALGAGVGGGSLIYANVSIDAKCDLFKQGWPPEITYDELKPYYAKVATMLNVQQVPEGQWSERARLVREGADEAGYGDRHFSRLDLAVEFDPSWSYNLQDPHDTLHSKKVSRDIDGDLRIEQGTCVHLGNCLIGCDVKAKNTLDLNYIPLSEARGAKVRALHIARCIAPEAGGYRVRYDRIINGSLQAGSATCGIVIVAAGSLGSTELLLRCRDEFRTLPKLSQSLGQKWSGNGDFLTPAVYRDRRIFPSRGPTISVAIDFLGDKNLHGNHFLIEDGGFPDLLRNWIEAKETESGGRKRHAYLPRLFKSILQCNGGLDAVMPWFGSGRDAANGRLSLRRRWWLWGEKALHLDWRSRESEKTISAIIDMHKDLAKKTGGKALVPLSRYVVSPHPLGGCKMGTAIENGVVDHKGEVFGYENIFVADGAIIPKAIGANPSKTIGALAERIAQKIIDLRRGKRFGE